MFLVLFLKGVSVWCPARLPSRLLSIGCLHSILWDNSQAKPISIVLIVSSGGRVIIAQRFFTFFKWVNEQDSASILTHFSKAKNMKFLCYKNLLPTTIVGFSQIQISSSQIFCLVWLSFASSDIDRESGLNPTLPHQITYITLLSCS